MDEQANVGTVETAAPETMGTEGSGSGEWDIDIDAIYAELGKGDDEDGEPETDGGSEPGPEGEARQEKAEGEGAEAEKPASESEAEASAPDEPPKEDTYTLKHLDEVKTVGRDEVVALAQKGMDYDRIRGKLGEVTAELDDLKQWINTISGGQSIQDFRDGVDARRLADAEKIDPVAALQRVKLDRERKAFEAEKQKAATQQQADAEKQAAEQRRQKDIQDFVKAFPEVASKMQTDKDAIPAEVWDRVRTGESLTTAYSAYKAKQDVEAKDAEIKRLTAELEAAKTQKKNAARSTGSQKSDGEDSAYDPIAAGWNSV